MKIWIRGAGDLATGIASRLYRSGHQLLMTELPVPITVRRTVALSRAVYEQHAEVEDMSGELVHSIEEAMLEKAKLMAQSGANYAVHMLDPVSDDFSEDWVPINATNRGETAQRRVYLSGGTSDYDEFVTLTFSSAESSSNDEDKINSGEALRVYLLKVRAEAICGDSIAHCSAVFWGYGEDGIWNFTGFVQD